jgi:MFS family permease
VTTTAEFIRRHAIDVQPLRRHPAFRRLFIGNSVSNFGLQFTAVAVPVQMFADTGSSAFVGLLGLASLIPIVVFGLWGGAVADAVDRRKLLFGASMLMWMSTLGLLAQALAGRHSPLLLLGLTFVQSAGFAVASPTRGAIIPRLVGVADVPAANTLHTTMFTAAGVVGPLAAGPLLANAPIAWAYGIDAVAFTVVLWAAFRLPALPPSREPGRRLAGWSDVTEGLRYIWTSPVLLLSFAVDIAAMVLAMPRAIFPEVAADRFGAGSIGWLYASIAVGSVLAGLTSGWIGRVRRQGLAIVAAVVVWGVAVAFAGLAQSLWLAVALLAVGGAADLVSAVYRQTILQTYAPDGFQGRMQGIFIVVVAGGPRLGDLRAGAAAYYLGPTVAWVSGGVAASIVAVVLAVAFPALVRYTRRAING